MPPIFRSMSRSDGENAHIANKETNGEATRRMPAEKVTGDNDKQTDDERSDERKTIAGRAAEVKLPPGFPLDRGWAWAILAGYFIITFMLAGYAMAMSIFLLEFVQMFQVPVSTAATFLGIHSACNGIGRPKTTVLIGACMFSVMSISLFLAPSIMYVNIAHIFIGASFPFMTLPSTTLLNTYFRSRRAFAMSLGLTGVSVASISVPPLVQYFISSFGPRGALLLTGGLQMHTLVSGLLMRSISYYKRRPAAVTGSRELSHGKTFTNVITEESDDIVDSRATTEHVTISLSHLQKNSMDKEQDNAATKLLDDCDQPKAFLPTTFNITQAQDVKPDTRPSLTGLDRNVITEETSLSCPGENHTLQMSSLNREKTMSHEKQPAFPDKQRQIDPMPSESWRGTNTLPSDPKENGDCKSEAAITGRFGFMSSTSLYRNWLFWLLMVYVPLMLSYTRIGIYLPSLAVSQGVSRPDAALLLTVSGSLGLISRVAIGYLADLKLLKSTHIVAFCMTVVGLAAQFCRFFTSFWLLVIMAVINGTLGHAGMTLNTVVIIDLLGLQHLPKVLGFVLLVNSAWNALNHPLIGTIADATGSFAIAYNYIGACVLASVFVLMMEPIARRHEAKRLQKPGSPLVCKHRSPEEG